MSEQNEVKLWREHTRRKIWIEYLATFEDSRLVRLQNLTNGCDIPLNTRTARMIANRNTKFRIEFPASAPITIPPTVRMRYAIRHETARYTAG